jgi:hypothetical protein
MLSEKTVTFSFMFIDKRIPYNFTVPYLPCPQVWVALCPWHETEGALYPAV